MVTIDDARRLFEAEINKIPRLKAIAPLHVLEENGRFSQYANSETDSMWTGFALGMRCAERVAAAQVPHKGDAA